MPNAKISALTSATTPLAGTETLPIVQSSTTKQVSVANLTAGRAVSASSLTATSGGVSVKGGPTGYGGDEIAMTTTASSFCAISTQMVGGTLYFDHRGTGNNGNWTWRNGTGAATNRMTLGATGDLTVNTGNVIISTSGKGIDFSATPGTGTSELFADYEEGAWTPSLTSAGGNFTTINYGDQQGSYTKIGRMVKVRGNLFTSGAITAGAASGNVYITGLPFTVGVSDIGNIWFNPDTANYNMPLALATGCFVVSTALRLFKNGTVNNPTFNVTDLYVLGGPANNMFFEATYMV
jgi:hypothetical protein